MPKDNSLKIIHCYSSIENKRLIEGFIADLADTTRRTKSVCRDDLILNHIFTGNPSTDYWLRELFAQNHPMSEIMENIFGYLAGGTNWEAKQTEETMPLIEFAYEQFRRNKDQYQSTKSPDKFYWDFFSHNIRMIKQKIEHEEKPTDGISFSADDQAEILRLIETGDGASADLTQLSDQVYAIIMNRWSILYNFTYTFRALALISRNQIWTNNAETRMRLRRILITAAKKWR